MRLFVEGVGIVGPGLNGWQTSRAILAGKAPYVAMPTLLTASDLLPAAERRRTGTPVKLALAAGCEAFANAGRDAALTATVLTSSGGDGDNVHHICETLAVAVLEVSPTRFHNSVHNAAAGYWNIAVHSREPSTSLCGHDSSFAAGLLEAMTLAVIDDTPVLLVAYDTDYPEPLHSKRPIPDTLGVALVISPQKSARSVARLTLEHDEFLTTAGAGVMDHAALEFLRQTIPAARALPLLQAIAMHRVGPVVLTYLEDTQLAVGVRF